VSAALNRSFKEGPFCNNRQTWSQRHRRLLELVVRGFPLIGSIVYWYTLHMLKSYRHKGIKQFAETGSKAGIQPEHANRLRRLLSALDAATCPANMNAPGYALHPLKGELEGHWAVRVSGNWRLTFAFEGEDAILVDYKDYH
jgi:proteic killer suppression protein